MADAALIPASLLLAACGLHLVMRGRRGERKHRSRRYAMGSALLACAVCGLTFVAYNFVRFTNWYPYKPTSWLISEARDQGDEVAQAYHELFSRFSAGKLDERQMKKFTAVALPQHVQSTPLGNLLPRSFRLRALNEVRQRGGLTEQQKSEFFDALVVCSMKARPKADVDKGIPIAIELRTFGEWGPMPLSSRVQVGPLRLSRPGQPELHPVEWGPARKRAGSTAGESSVHKATTTDPWHGAPVTLQGPAAATLELSVAGTDVGPHEFECQVTFDLFEEAGPARVASPPLYRVTRVLRAETEVVRDPSVSRVEIVTDAALRPDVDSRDPWKAGLWRISGWPFVRYLPPDYTEKRWYVVSICNPPVGVAFDVEIGAGGKSFTGGRILQASDSCIYWDVTLPPEVWAERVFGILLTPNPTAAEESVDITEIWGESVQLIERR